MKDQRYYKRIYQLHKLLEVELSDLIKLTDEQVNYIYYNVNSSTYLEACPGSGKTEVIGIKTAFEIARWKQPNNGIVVTTFTTSAARELNSRIYKYGKNH